MKNTKGSEMKNTTTPPTPPPSAATSTPKAALRLDTACPMDAIAEEQQETGGADTTPLVLHKDRPAQVQERMTLRSSSHTPTTTPERKTRKGAPSNGAGSGGQVPHPSGALSWGGGRSPHHPSAPP